VHRDVDGSFVTLTVDGFSDDFLARLGTPVQEVHRMNLEDIFVATVMHSRQAQEARPS
jgi:ABC-2 type transport system ATP-binding protein